MLELPGQPRLDKATLVGGCIRLRLRLDATRLAAEVDALPADFWGSSSGRVGVHRGAEAVFLRGFAPADGNRPIEDRPALEHLPYLRCVLETQIAAVAQRCLLARIPGGASIAPHIDRAPYFSQTIRLHVAVTTHERAFMLCAGLCYVMRPGEIWAINNTATHGVWNADETRDRTHLICDFLPSPALYALLDAGERDLGERRPDVEAHLGRLPPKRLGS
jgi:aspartyl/asparaginyl beta-hydroxylase